MKIILTSIAIAVFAAAGICHELQYRKHGETFKEGSSKVTVRRYGDVHGMWFESEKCVMGLITRHKAYERYNNDCVPFVQVFLKDSPSPLPFALNFQGGELKLQIPETKTRLPEIVPLSHIIELLEKEHQERAEKAKQKRKLMGRMNLGIEDYTKLVQD